MINKRKRIKEIIKNNYYILSLVKKASPYYITFSILITLTAFNGSLFYPWLTKYIFDSMTNNKPYISIIYFTLAFLCSSLGAEAMQTIISQKMAPVNEEKIKQYIRTLVFEKTKFLDLYCFENAEFYDKYIRALTEADSRAFGVLSSLSSMSYCLISFVTLNSLIIYLDPTIIIFSVSYTIISALINKKLAKLKYDYNVGKTPFDRQTAYINRVFYEPQYVKDIKMDNMHYYFIQSYKDAVSAMIKYIKNRTNKIAFFNFIDFTMFISMQLFMILFMTYRVYTGRLTIGDYAALMNIIFMSIHQLKNLFNLFPQFYEHSLYIQNIKDVLQQNPNIEKDSGLSLSPNDKISIKFVNVTFSYPETDITVLKNLNLSFCAGEKYAIVGHNGAGKSTLIKLILRLYDVTEGEIFINGINIKNYNVHSLRACISTVFQDFQLYSIPIADYILSNACIDQLNETTVNTSLKTVGLYDKVAKYKNGINSILSREFDDNGVIMSGGEYQKLALAKAFAQNSTIMILDEPSSALDPISEYELHKNMIEFSRNNTVILISHRLSTTKDAKVIYYLEDGKLLEYGSHDELMKRNEKYAKMFNVQAINYQM